MLFIAIDVIRKQRQKKGDRNPYFFCIQVKVECVHTCSFYDADNGPRPSLFVDMPLGNLVCGNKIQVTGNGVTMNPNCRLESQHCYFLLTCQPRMPGANFAGPCPCFKSNVLKQNIRLVISIKIQVMLKMSVCDNSVCTQFSIHLVIQVTLRTV